MNEVNNKNKRVFPINIAREQAKIDNINKLLAKEDIVSAKNKITELLNEFKKAKYPDTETINKIQKFLDLLNNIRNDEPKNYKTFTKLNWEE